VQAQNSPSTVVHGCTTVEDGSNGLTTPLLLRFLSTLPDAFILLKKIAQNFMQNFVQTEGNRIR